LVVITSYRVQAGQRCIETTLQVAFFVGYFGDLGVFGLNGLFILVVVPKQVSPGSKETNGQEANN